MTRVLIATGSISVASIAYGAYLIVKAARYRW
jgi:hypothetical protein